MPSLPVSNPPRRDYSQGSRIVVCVQEEAGAAGMPRLAFTSLGGESS
jgi:hypothetical protein